MKIKTITVSYRRVIPLRPYEVEEYILSATFDATTEEDGKIQNLRANAGRLIRHVRKTVLEQALNEGQG